jgi:uncharacterized protein YoxC
MITSIIKWLKIIGLAIMAIGAAVFVISAMRNKTKEKESIDQKIQEIKNLEVRTDADIAKLKDLHEERAKIEEGIQNTSNVYTEKIKELMKKPDEPKKGDAAKSADNMKDVW